MRRIKLERGQLQTPEWHPEDGEETHNHHGGEAVHDPLESHGDEEEGEVDENNMSLFTSTISDKQVERCKKRNSGMTTYTTDEKTCASPHYMRTMENVNLQDDEPSKVN